MKLECYIVRDLLPSYIEKLTSPETETDVREHLKECEACREIHGNMSNEIENKKRETGIQEHADYVKKREKRYIIKIVAAAIVLLFILQRFLLAYLGIADEIQYEMESYLVVLTVLLWYLCKNMFKSGRKWDRAVVLIHIFMFLLSAASAVGMFLLLGMTKQEWVDIMALLGGDVRVGRYIMTVLVIEIFGSVAVVIYGVYASIIKSDKYFGLVSHGLGCFLMMVYFRMVLSSLDLPLHYSQQDVLSFMQWMVFPYLIGVVLTVFYYFRIRRSARKSVV